MKQKTFLYFIVSFYYPMSYIFVSFYYCTYYPNIINCFILKKLYFKSIDPFKDLSIQFINFLYFINLMIQLLILNHSKYIVDLIFQILPLGLIFMIFYYFDNYFYCY